MNYSDVLSRAYRTLKTPAYWAYGFSATIVAMLPMAVAGGIMWGVVGVSRVSALVPHELRTAPGTGELFAALGLLYATLILGGLFMWPIVVTTAGGYIHISDQIIAGAPVSVGGAWAFGLRRFGRTLGIGFLLGLAYAAAALLASMPFVLAVVAGVAGAKGSSGATVALGFCCGYLYFIIALMVIAFVYSSVNQLALRYGLVGGRTVGDSIACGWKAFRARWKTVLWFSLILMVIAMGYGLLSSAITYPVQLIATQGASGFGRTSDPTQAASAIFGSLAVYPLTALITVPLTLFVAASWAAFFRQLTGLDVPPAPAPVAYAYPPPPTPTYDIIPTAPQPPAAPTEPPPPQEPSA